MSAVTPFPLAAALTQRVQALSHGLAQGETELLEWVTPTTATLLRWWFMDEHCQNRPFNFHAGQRQAILNVLFAHEVLAGADPVDLYRQVCPDALLEDPRFFADPAGTRHLHPKYCLKMATGTGKTWVLQALLIWQLLNHGAAQDAGRDDPRYTRRFLIVTPGLIVYERVLDALLGKETESGSGLRDFARSDLARYGELFIPPAWRESVCQFVQGNTCRKSDIGQRSTGNGLIAVANWHFLAEAEAEAESESEAEAPQDEPATEPRATAPGLPHDIRALAQGALPVSPLGASGSSLATLDQRWARGGALAYLATLPDLMVFNDEAHHIHQVRKAGQDSEVEWQKRLSRIADGKGRRFVQVDFSATPYSTAGTRGGKRHFPHIVADFDLVAAMKAGLVKSLVLDKRKELGALPLDFKVERDDDGNLRLSAGQRVMLRAGLHKLRRLETDFAPLDAARSPKMLVVCEDTQASRCVEAFLREEGLHADEVLTIDSGRKAALGEAEWARVRTQLFDVDRHAFPRVIVSVAMLREGFDASNICVIVPLRASQAPILLEQTIGRGLRLMWREPEYAELKRENRERIGKRQAPDNLLDVLSIIEHPAFERFYDELMAQGLVTHMEEADAPASSVGDVQSIGLREDYARYDFAIPFLLHEAEQVLDHTPIEVGTLPAFVGMSPSALAAALGKGDVFRSRDLLSSTVFGDYRVQGEVMEVSGYNELLSRLTRRIIQALNGPLPRGRQVSDHLPRPYLRVGGQQLALSLDDYIRTGLFGGPFDPFIDERWRVLLLEPVLQHIVREFGLALALSATHTVQGNTQVVQRRLSEVDRLAVRASCSLQVHKCIYPRLGYPARQGGLERAFMAWANADAAIEAFCRIQEHRHDFARLRYLKQDGLTAFYYPDFLVRTADAIYLAETKAQQQVTHPDVQRKLRAAAAWCGRVNAWPPEHRSQAEWHYALVGEAVFGEFYDKGASLAELLHFCRVRAAATPADQGRLAL